MIPCEPADLRKGWTRLPRPILVVEVLSEGSRRFDTVAKRDAYLRWRIADYWMVDLDERTVTVARRGQSDATHSTQLTWQPAGADKPLVIDVKALVRDALGE